MSLFKTDFPGLHLLHRGKVRDIYKVGRCLLIVATDRLSAFDVVLPTPITGKGRILTQMSLFWFEKLKDLVPNHLVQADVTQFPQELKPFSKSLEGRSMLVKEAKPLPIECIVRGYIAGSGWKDYLRNGSVCGIKLPEGMLESQQLPDAIFTPSTKADVGSHDENISFEQVRKLLGKDVAEKARDISIGLYKIAANYARERGVIIADTKFELGISGGELMLIDEVLTPDSSRFWPAEDYSPGSSQPSFDKQFVRDYLESISWDKKPPGPELPADIAEKTRKRYLEALRRLTDKG
ncbi:MAG: phosphoribosylaminoimidazolesuccinocarboxamide synthase [Deltaproteobacteria bacterium]|nr:phosphoribosylaminoimidazolesuccinocarboxamide synthase [Deltaproteobacteria bacterium]MBW1718357.1 phosphoribosylaminoimidazolesuccinocarboxamide synthase [Deltaproteobacteria bacterium]MBW2081102.1 phosphoribosylaminoimidazolesuccinocarboxamide synthase [Deltaproteobacteria bacterium]MBW2349834.1 phosphoribosylaminoimidazolesuccinocarboxamide synthase [Deltaproteobacteria bacterium]